MLKRARSIWRSCRVYFRIVRTWVLRRRCINCGLLGMYDTPEQVNAPIGDLQEIGMDARNGIRWELKSARRRGLMRGEYDFRQSRPLGTTTRIHGGMKCGVDHTFGARTTWMILNGIPTGMAGQAMQDGYVLRVPDEQNPLGKPEAVAQTFIDSLVKPHDCKQYRKHRPGLSPQEHTGERREKVRTALYVLGAVGGVATIITLVITLVSG